MDFHKKVCIVTGGANGIGRCLVDALVTRGASVAFIDPDLTAGQRQLERWPESSIMFFPGDLTVEADCRHFAAAVVSRFGSVDYLINNACVGRRGILSSCSFDDFNYVLHLGVTAPYFLTMLLRDSFASRAAIVNISSTRAFMSQADTESYSAAKGGISALTHALSVSLAGKVRVNAICPGWIDTGAYQESSAYVPDHAPSDRLQHPAGRVGNPEDIVSAVLFLCSDEASFITGASLTVDGGMSKLMIYSGDHGWSFDPGQI